VTQIDLTHISEILRTLPPRQEKVIRLYFGLGCQRPHSASEIGDAFQVSPQVIAGILGAAERRLARLGLTPMQMRAAARRETERHPPPGARSLPESKPKSWSGHRAHR
jgi:DNA-directed RNA polymerase sigma subunit (sigma70/sigma32)